MAGVRAAPPAAGVMAPLWAGLLVSVILERLASPPAFYPLRHGTERLELHTPFLHRVGGGRDDPHRALQRPPGAPSSLAALFHFQAQQPAVARCPAPGICTSSQDWALVVVWLDRRRMLAPPGSGDGGVTGW